LNLKTFLIKLKGLFSKKRRVSNPKKRRVSNPNPSDLKMSNTLVSCFKVGKHLCNPPYLETMCRLYNQDGPDNIVDLCIYFDKDHCLHAGEVTATEACEIIRKIAADVITAPETVRSRWIVSWEIADIQLQKTLLEQEAKGINVFHLEKERPKEIKIMLPTDCEWFEQRPENFIEPLIHLEVLEGVTEITFITLDDGVHLCMEPILTSWLDSSIADNSFDYHTYFVVNPRFTTPLKMRIPRIQWVKWAVQKKKGQPSTILADWCSLMGIV